MQSSRVFRVLHQLAANSHRHDPIRADLLQILWSMFTRVLVKSLRLTLLTLAQQVFKIWCPTSSQQTSGQLRPMMNGPDSEWYHWLTQIHPNRFNFACCMEHHSCAFNQWVADLGTHTFLCRERCASSDRSPAVGSWVSQSQIKLLYVLQPDSRMQFNLQWMIELACKYICMHVLPVPAVASEGRLSL